MSRVVALVLQGDQGKVDAHLLQQLAVCSPLHSLAVLKANNDVGISDRRQAMGDSYGRPSTTSLEKKKRD